MLTPKDEGINNWLIFFKQVSFSYCFNTLNASITFGKQDDLTQPQMMREQVFAL